MGTRSGWASPKHKNERCKDCSDAHRAARRRERVETVARLYNEGRTYREIAQALGYGPTSLPPEVAQARALGLIGYRYRVGPSTTSPIIARDNTKRPGDAPTSRGMAPDRTEV